MAAFHRRLKGSKRRQWGRLQNVSLPRSTRFLFLRRLPYYSLISIFPHTTVLGGGVATRTRMEGPLPRNSDNVVGLGTVTITVSPVAE